MTNYKYGCLIALFIFFNTFYSAHAAMTKSQIKQAGKLLRNVCQPKNKVTNEQVDNIKNGEFIEDRNVMCYIACIFTMAQSVKNGKINYESGIKQIDMNLPDPIKEPAKVALTNCKHNGEKYKDLCEASFNLAKCLYKENPEVFVFP